MHPIPGDPDLVETQAASMKEAAEAMSRAAKTLEAVSNGSEFTSHSTDALKANAGHLHQTMTKAATRYRGTAVALGRFAPVLRAAQDEANAAISALDATDVHGAHWNSEQANAEANALRFNPLAGPSEVAEAEAKAARASEHLQDQQRAAAAAQSRWQAAKDSVDIAGRIAAGQIHDAVGASHLNDPKPKFSWKEFLNRVYDVLDVVSTVISVAAVLLCWVPVVGEILAVAALVVAVLKFTVAAIQVARHERDGRDLLFDGADVVLSIIPGGKALSKLVRMGKTGKLVKALHGEVPPVTRKIFFNTERGVVHRTKTLERGDFGGRFRQAEQRLADPVHPNRTTWFKRQITLREVSGILPEGGFELGKHELFGEIKRRMPAEQPAMAGSGGR
jgi:hypothetical protein